MRGHRRSFVVAALVLALAACATNSTVREPMPAPGTTVIVPPNAGHGAPNPASRCIAGDGRVVRLTNPDGHDAAGTMSGGVLGGVLGNATNEQDAHPSAGGNGPGHDLYVQMDDGRKLIVSQRELGGIGMGSRVSVDANCRARLVR
ncbi:MAG TPA: hypothetical protein VGH80_03730 [Xanthomonadaceae bacterium]|jgi:hypothetical protein